MWQEKLKEIINILENSNVNEIEVSFWGKKFKVVKSGSSVLNSVSESVNVQNHTSEPKGNTKEKLPEQEEISSMSDGEDLLSLFVLFGSLQARAGYRV